MTDATQSLLPVTPEDRMLVNAMYRFARMTNGTGHDDALQAAAQHRQDPSLPGDVGMRDLLEDCREWLKDFGGDSGLVASKRAKLRSRIDAALTPSPCREAALTTGEARAQDRGGMIDFPGVGTVPEMNLAALTPSAQEQQWGGLLEDGLCDDHGRFMCPKCRYPVPSALSPGWTDKGREWLADGAPLTPSAGEILREPVREYRNLAAHAFKRASHKGAGE